ncbi:unnamed protein product [marine sediment metagenome]|uniref:Uncharacterized protein n=1 Tax=marine sediment metagenome TaxID=412755 RepID=X0XC10_9ZZZZ
MQNAQGIDDDENVYSVSEEIKTVKKFINEYADLKNSVIGEEEYPFSFRPFFGLGNTYRPTRVRKPVYKQTRRKKSQQRYAKCPFADYIGLTPTPVYKKKTRRVYDEQPDLGINFRVDGELVQRLEVQDIGLDEEKQYFPGKGHVTVHDNYVKIGYKAYKIKEDQYGDDCIVIGNNVHYITTNTYGTTELDI